jgi:hypothetical protein
VREGHERAQQFEGCEDFSLIRKISHSTTRTD